MTHNTADPHDSSSSSIMARKFATDPDASAVVSHAESVDCVVIGAGVVGLAVAAALGRKGRDVLVLEQEAHFGGGISSRNSEVIHAGIYYPRDSLKAALCVEGRERLYRYCDSRAIPSRQCGKLIVATSAGQVAELARIKACALDNGVGDIRTLCREDVSALEPQLNTNGALLSPSTGIVDSHALMLSLTGDIERAGGVIAYQTPVVSIQVSSDAMTVVTGGPDPCLLQASIVVNAAGLGALALMRAQYNAASRVSGPGPRPSQPKQILAKGNYFRLSGQSPVSRLVYPVPEPGGLGVHITLDMNQSARFGPDVEWVEAADYTVDPQRADSFYAAIRRYWPALKDGALTPDYAGIRPKVSFDDDIYNDFLMHDSTDHGVPGLIHLAGIESPGLTASLAIAQHVANSLC